MATTTVPISAPSAGRRVRLREVVPDIHLGSWKPGPKNGITDVPGVLVHTQSIHDPGSGSDSGSSINTGVTVILPREDWFHNASYAGIFRFNGAGELTGSHWIEETGLLRSPVVLTNTFSVGAAYTGIYQHAVEHHSDPERGVDWFLLPVVGETFDGHLSDVTAFAVTPQHVRDAIAAVSADPVPEGNTGGGTGMTCQGFKGGTGTSSRLVPGLPGEGSTYTVAALVQANYGSMESLRVAGVPVGRILAAERRRDAATRELDAANAAAKDRKDGSIIVVLATDAPLHPLQLQRLAKRATAGLARVGGYGHNSSGDIFIAFSTANAVPVEAATAAGEAVDPYRPALLDVQVADDQSINGLLEAAADATEEAICNALCMAETMVGYRGNTMEALPLDRLREIMAKYT